MLCSKCKSEIDKSFRFCPYCGKEQEAIYRPKRKPRRRENGAGSVYKRKDLKRRPWVAVTPDIRFKGSEVIGYYATAQEAKDALEEYRRNPTTKLNITFSQLKDEWKAIYYKNISPQLQANYDSSYTNSCNPLIGEIKEMKFKEIRTSHLQQIIDFYASEHPGKDRKGNEGIIPALSHSSLSKMKIFWNLLYEYAMQNDIINKNYAAFVSLPKQEKKQKSAFTDVEVSKIEKACGVVPNAELILIMIYTGFRISEFLGLTPFSYDKKRGGLTGGMKTEAGKDRFVPIHPKIQPYLDQWLAKKGQTIFCREDGSPMAPNYFRKYKYYPALEAIGVRKLTPHATRHTFATRLSSADARMEDITALIGHEDYSVTANTYIHQDDEELRKAILKMA